MKVLHVVNAAIFPLEGGHSIRNHNVFKKLHSKVSELLIVPSILSIDEKNLARELIIDEVAYKYILTAGMLKWLRYFHKIPSFNRPLQLFLVYFNYRLIKKLVDINNYDVIHGHSNHNNGLSAYLLSKKFNKPFVYDLHALSIDIYKKSTLKYWFAKKIETFLIKKAKVIITIDQELKEHIAITFNKPAEVIFPAPNGIDCNFFKKDLELKKSDLAPKNKFIIGIDNSKAIENAEFIFRNQEELINNFPNVFFLVFGNKDKNLVLNTDFFKILPKISYSEMPKYYSLLNLYIMPRFHNKMSETITPLKILELMSCEVPVLVSDVKGLSICIRDEESGFIFNLDEGIAGLQKRLAHILKFREIDKIRQKARQWVIQNKSWEDAAKQYIKAYKTLLN
jgi:glycosyltransferase involved in cell wall biosynthesis